MRGPDKRLLDQQPVVAARSEIAPENVHPLLPVCPGKIFKGEATNRHGVPAKS
jgi:hypothetical protein